MSALETLSKQTVQNVMMTMHGNVLFVLDDKRQFYMLRPDDQFIGGKSHAYLVRVINCEMLTGATIETIKYTDAEELTNDKHRYHFRESEIHTSKGVCTIITVLVDGVKGQSAPLICERFKGYPPPDAQPLHDFTCKPGRFRKEPI